MKYDMIRKAAALLALLLLTQAPGAKAQRFHVVVDYHYNLGFGEDYAGLKLRRNHYDMSGHSLHVTALYDITKRISAGAGIGADRYEEPGYNTFPLFGTFRYRPMRRFLDGYLFTNLGYGLFAREDIYGGWMWDAGVGYTKMFRRHFGLNFQVGYNLKEFKDVPFFGETMTWTDNLRHSLSLGVGLVF